VTEEAQARPDGGALTVQQLTEEIQRLRDEVQANRSAAAFREVLLATGAAGIIGAPLPHDDVLQAIVETAADVLQAEAGALFLLDAEGDDLVFQVALGGRAEKVKHFKVPLGHGIAGYVAATGQPLAVADAERDPRFAREIGEASGYRPSTVLCVPLFLRERVIGVLELLNKIGGGPFTPRDMDLLGRFGRLAALAVDQSRLAQDLRHLFRSLLADAFRDGPLAAAGQRFAETTAARVEHAPAIQLAGLLRDLSRRGEETQKLAIEVLSSVARYVAARDRTA
jgi:GAF domain-containing protein